MLKNLTFFLFIPWLLFQTVTGQETKIVWIQKEPGVIDSGRCFEVDKKINLKNYKGQKIFQYVKEIPTKKCLPKNKTSYIFIFSVGRCFEGDTETQGQIIFHILVQKIVNLKIYLTKL